MPVAYDETTVQILRAAQLGAVDGFIGELDANGDSLAVFETDLLGPSFGDELPPSMLFTYVVFDDDVTTIEFVSNAFEVQFQQ